MISCRQMSISPLLFHIIYRYLFSDAYLFLEIIFVAIHNKKRYYMEITRIVPLLLNNDNCIVLRSYFLYRESHGSQNKVIFYGNRAIYKNCHQPNIIYIG